MAQPLADHLGMDTGLEPQMRRRGMEIKEVVPNEAKLILEDATTWDWIVADAKTQEVIREIGPEFEEIVIIGMLAGGEDLLRHHSGMFPCRLVGRG
jgi:hypothetical protein